MADLHQYVEKRTNRGIPDLLAFLSNNGVRGLDQVLDTVNLQNILDTELADQVRRYLISPRIPVTKAITAINQTIGSADFSAQVDAGVENFQRFKTWFFAVSGTWTGTFTFEVSLDNSAWFPANGFTIQATQSSPTGTFTANGLYAIESGFPYARLRASAFASGTANFTAQVSMSELQNKINAVSGSGIFQVARTELTRYADSSTNLGIGATFTGSARDFSSVNRTKFVAQAVADQAGTLFIERAAASGGPYFVIRSVAVVANTPVELEGFLCSNFGRVRYLNGGVAQTSFSLVSMAYMI